MECKILPDQPSSVATLGRCTKAKMTTVWSCEAQLVEQNEHARARATKPITILAESESLVAVLTSKRCLMTIEWIQTANLEQQLLPGTRFA